MVTERQREIVHALGNNNENRKTVAKKLGITVRSLDSTLTYVYHCFLEDLQFIDENFPVFERRFKKKSQPNKDTHTHLRRIARKMRENNR
jgi:hypothetical protein